MLNYPMWYILIPYIILLVFGNILYKANKKPVLQTMFMVDFWAIAFGIIVFGISFFIFDDLFANFTWTAFGLISLRTLLGAGTFFCFLQALKRMPISIVEPTMVARIFPLLLVGQFVFGDAVALVPLILSITIFVTSFALAYVSRKDCEDERAKNNYLGGLMWIAICIALTVPKVTIIRHLSADIHIIALSIVGFLVSPIVSITALLATKQSPIKVFKELWKDKILMGIAIPDNFWVLFWVPLALSMNIGLLDAVLVSVTALTVVAGVILLKEKVRWQSYILIAIILACAVAISLL